MLYECTNYCNFTDNGKKIEGAINWSWVAINHRKFTFRWVACIDFALSGRSTVTWTEEFILGRYYSLKKKITRKWMREKGREQN